jgi:hypothetical protein
VRHLSQRIDDYERIEAGWKHSRRFDRIGDTLNKVVDAVSTWQKLHEECDMPLELGNRVNGRFVSRALVGVPTRAVLHQRSIPRPRIAKLATVTTSPRIGADGEKREMPTPSDRDETPTEAEPSTAAPLIIVPFESADR